MKITKAILYAISICGLIHAISLANAADIAPKALILSKVGCPEFTALNMGNDGNLVAMAYCGALAQNVSTNSYVPRVFKIYIQCS